MTNSRETQAFVRHRYSGLLIIACTLGFVAPSLSSETTIAIHYCKAKQAIGIAIMDSIVGAVVQSDSYCKAFGGNDACCEAIETTDTGCLAIAVASDGSYGIGKGDKANEASSRAVEACVRIRTGCIVKAVRCIDEPVDENERLRRCFGDRDEGNYSDLRCTNQSK